jgi:hypothetical protein
MSPPLSPFIRSSPNPGPRRRREDDDGDAEDDGADRGKAIADQAIPEMAAQPSQEQHRRQVDGRADVVVLLRGTPSPKRIRRTFPRHNRHAESVSTRLSVLAGGRVWRVDRGVDRQTDRHGGLGATAALGQSALGEVSIRMGREGEDVRNALRVLTANPSEMSVFREDWPRICSEQRTCDAAFAAAPTWWRSRSRFRPMRPASTSSSSD